MVRASSGHSIPWLEYGMILHTLDEYEVHALPAMVHGTKVGNLPGILDQGLNAGRTFCMFNMIPHYDARSEMGQRFDDWNSLVFSIPCRLILASPTRSNMRWVENSLNTTKFPSTWLRAAR